MSVRRHFGQNGQITPKISRSEIFGKIFKNFCEIFKIYATRPRHGGFLSTYLKSPHIGTGLLRQLFWHQRYQKSPTKVILNVTLFGRTLRPKWMLIDKKSGPRPDFPRGDSRREWQPGRETFKFRELLYPLPCYVSI